MPQLNLAIIEGIVVSSGLFLYACDCLALYYEINDEMLVFENAPLLML